MLIGRGEKWKTYNLDSQRQSEDEAVCDVKAGTEPFGFCSLDSGR